MHKSLASRILTALGRCGPLCNRELQDLCEAHGGEIARDCTKLIARGLVERCDSATGRGTRALYRRAA